MIRVAARAVLVMLALVVALLVETAIVPNTALVPVVPSLVLMVVIATALPCGPVAGAGAGFAGGLLLDVAPPAVATLGSTVLVMCLVGAACGYTKLLPVRSAVLKVPLTVVTVAAGTVMWVAGMSVMAEVVRPGPTGASWANAVHVLGPLVVAHLAVCPVVVPAIAALVHMVPAAPAQAQELLPAQRGSAHVRAGAPQWANQTRPVASMPAAMIRKGR